jgi:hypothetical protein
LQHSLILLPFIVYLEVSKTRLAAMAYASSFGRAEPAEGLQAEIYEDGVLTRVLPLDGASDIVVNTSRGYNRIIVENGGVRVSEADCDSQTCVHSGTKVLPGDMIACLPHRLVIKIGGGETPYDAIAY